MLEVNSIAEDNTISKTIELPCDVKSEDVCIYLHLKQDLKQERKNDSCCFCTYSTTNSHNSDSCCCCCNCDCDCCECCCECCCCCCNCDG